MHFINESCGNKSARSVRYSAGFNRICMNEGRCVCVRVLHDVCACACICVFANSRLRLDMIYFSVFMFVLSPFSEWPVLWFIKDASSTVIMCEHV